MAATGDNRRRLLTAGIISLLATTGCSAGDDPPADRTGPSPTVTASPAMDLVGDESDFPTEARRYAESTVAAWAAPDLFQLAKLATPAVQQEIIELPGPPKPGWRFIGCEPTTTHTDCTFHNADGDHLRLTVEAERLGQARAVTAMAFDPASYPHDALAYVAEFLTGWQTGNSARMNNLAVPAAVAAFAQLPPAEQVDYQLGELTHPIAVIQVTFADVVWEVRVNQLMLGAPQAIRTITDAG